MHTLRGVVVGATPAANAQVQIKDSTGATVTVTTDSTGHYTADIANMAAPFRLQAIAGGTSLYALANAEGVANVTTLTNFVLDTMSQTRGSTAGATFAATTVTLPSAAEISSYDNALRAVVAPALSADGVSSATISAFDPVTTAFDTTGTGIDQVVRNCTVGTNGSAQTTLTVQNDPSGSAYSSTTTVTVTSDASGANSSAQFQTTTTTNTTSQGSPPASQSCSPPTGTLQFSASAYSVNENAGSVTITVTRTGGSAGAASVNYATSNGSGVAGTDYTAASGTLNWVAGDAASKTFAVSITDRGLTTGTHTVALALSGASGASAGSPASAVLTINDNDAAGALQFSSSAYSVSEDGGSVTITVSRAGGSSGAASVSYATSNGTGVAGTDYTAASGTLNWTNGDAASKTFVVTVAHDSATTASRTVSLGLSSASGASLGSPASATLTITNTDAAKTALTPAVTAAGDLVLLDPADPTHPITVDSGLSAADFADQSDESYEAFDVSGTSISSIRMARLVYVKGGKVFKVNLETGQSHTPVQVSSITDACNTYAAQPQDRKDIDNSGLFVNHACGSGAPKVALLRLSSTASDAGIALNIGGSQAAGSAAAFHDAQGAVTGLINMETVGGQLSVVQRDANFANPVTLAAIDFNPQPNSSHIHFHEATTVDYLAFMPHGSGTWKVFGFNQNAAAGSGLTPALYTFGTPSPLGCVNCDFHSDGTNLYFIDGTKVIRLPLSATTAGQAQVVTTLAHVVEDVETMAGSNRLVLQSADGVFTIDRNATNGTPTTLLAAANFSEIDLFGPQGSMVYATTFDASHVPTAHRISADGATDTIVDTGFWSGVVFPQSTTVDPATGEFADGDFNKFLLVSGGSSTATLKAYDAAAGTIGLTLGSVTGAVVGDGMFGDVVGGQGFIEANFQRTPSTSDTDVYYVDASAANSLTAAVGSAGGNDFVLGF